MAQDDDFEQALEALARVEGKTVAELKHEMLRERVMGARQKDPAPAAIVPSTGDASAPLARVRRDAIDRHQRQEYPGSPVVRYGRDPYGETAEEAQERWLEEEAMLPDGVHGLGGQSAGGIFGGGAIATSIYDPEAMGRADSRAGQLVNAKLLQVIERLERRLPPAEDERPSLPRGSERRRLGR